MLRVGRMSEFSDHNLLPGQRLAEYGNSLVVGTGMGQLKSWNCKSLVVLCSQFAIFKGLSIAQGNHFPITNDQISLIR